MSSRRAKMKKDIIPSAGRDVEQQELSLTANGCVN